MTHSPNPDKPVVYGADTIFYAIARFNREPIKHLRAAEGVEAEFPQGHFADFTLAGQDHVAQRLGQIATDTLVVTKDRQCTRARIV